MPKTKNALIRQKVIDKCLRSPKFYSTKDLMEACNRALVEAGEHPVTSTNTIRDDLNQISANYPQAVIVEQRKGRNIFYSYEDKDFSIYQLPLKDEDFAQLTQTVLLLSRFEGMPHFEWLNELKESLHIQTDAAPIVGFDENIDLAGRNHFTGLFRAISDRQVLSLRYKNFRKDLIQEFIIHPYYLKQYNGRWFLMAWSQDINKLSVFAFDRIVSFEIQHLPYRVNESIDFNEYFDDMIGVTKKENAEIETVKIRIVAHRWPYVKTKPLHGSQRIVSTDERDTIIQIKVHINKELEQLLLSFGADMEVLEPLSLRECLKEKFKQGLRQYQSNCAKGFAQLKP